MDAMRRAVQVGALFLGSGISLAPTAFAGTITWQLEGTIDGQEQSCAAFGGYCDPFGEIAGRLATVGIEPGVSWFARLSFSSDATAVGDENSPELVTFEGAQVEISLEVGDVSGVPGGAAGFALGLFLAPLYADYLVFDGSLVGGTAEVVLDFSQLDLLSSRYTFSRTALPTDPPDRADLDSGTSFRIGGRALVPHADIFNPGISLAPFQLIGHIDKLTRVPEPAAQALFAVGALTLSALRLRARG